MCLALYLFTSSELPQSKWDESSPKLFVELVNKGADRGALDWPHSQRNKYYLGGYQGCGYGWAAVNEWDDDVDKEAKTKDRIRLSSLLQSIEQKNSWLVVCWEGDQGSKMKPSKAISASDIADPSFELIELQQYNITASFRGSNVSR